MWERGTGVMAFVAEQGFALPWLQVGLKFLLWSSVRNQKSEILRGIFQARMKEKGMMERKIKKKK